MKLKLAAAVIAAGTVLAPATGYAADARSKGTEVSPANVEKMRPGIDKAIGKQIQGDIAKGGSKVDVEVSKGTVKLTGTAKTRAEADKAAAIAKGTYGVTNVQNDIKVTGK